MCDWSREKRHDAGCVVQVDVPCWSYDDDDHIPNERVGELRAHRE